MAIQDSYLMVFLLTLYTGIFLFYFYISIWIPMNPDKFWMMKYAYLFRWQQKQLHHWGFQEPGYWRPLYTGKLLWENSAQLTAAPKMLAKEKRRWEQRWRDQWKSEQTGPARGHSKRLSLLHSQTSHCHHRVPSPGWNIEKNLTWKLGFELRIVNMYMLVNMWFQVFKMWVLLILFQK